ncbi:MAG TPA: CAP domain-containing protein, partial [Nitrososphaera sp.]|nr:CAP domain-containing protein [Nitrososphaera sp.]
MKTRQNKKQPLRKHVHRHLRLALVPHQANQYRPHLIRRYGLMAVFVLVIGIQLLYNVGTTGSVLGEKANISMAALLNGTNQARRNRGLDDLKLDEKLNRAAQLKAADMFAKQYWAHDSPDGTQPWKWLADADYNYSEAGENLALNFYTAEATMTAWLNSAEHKENILDPAYTDVGFAVASGMLKGKQATIVVALYA